MNFANLVAGLCLTLANPLIAQNVSLPASSSQVQACFLAAQQTDGGGAVRQGWTALEPCVEALEGQLDERQRIATLGNLAMIEVQLGDFDEAMKNYDLALSISDGYADIYLNRANLFYLKRDFAAAIRDYNEALRLNSSAAELVYLNRGMTYQNRGEYVLAESDYRAALTIRPGWILVVEKLQVLEQARQTTGFP